MAISGRILRNTEAVIVLVGAFAASFFIDSETLIPIAVGLLAVSVAGVYAARWGMQKLAARGNGADRALLLEVGVVLGMAALASFIVLLIELFD